MAASDKSTSVAPVEAAKLTPKADAPRCDLYGCGMLAATCTDGTEVDAQGLGRPALKNLNVCTRHTNWPHSEDAKDWAQKNRDLYARRGA